MLLQKSIVGFFDKYQLVLPLEVCQKHQKGFTDFEVCRVAHWAHVVAWVLGVCLTAGIHCWSDQLDRPDHPNSPTKLDWSSCTWLVPDLVRCVWSGSDWVQSSSDWIVIGRSGRVLINWCINVIQTTLDPYTINSRSIQPQYLITSRSLLERLATRLFDGQKLSCRKPNRCRPPRPLARPVPGRMIGVDRVDLIGSGNLA